MKRIEVLLLDPTKATLPTRAHAHDAGLDLYASADTPYKPGEVFVVKTDVAVGIEPGFVGLVRDRSSVSKTGLKVTAGVVDAGYTGECCVVMLNLSGEHGCVRRGQKIAQLLIMPVATPAVVETYSLGESARGVKGFGSSGA
jgi:dUTP pyrophosphatase